jgi:glycosyltransferase involved in cell wall biosynthesis
MTLIAVPLCGTDAGRSGLSTWVREVLPRLRDALAPRGTTLVALATPDTLSAYADTLRGIATSPLPGALDRPALGALWSLLALDTQARRCGADAVLLPAANRRAPLVHALPTVAVVHDMAAAHSAEKYGHLRQWFVGHALRTALRRSNALVAVSATTADELTTLLGPGTPRACVVPNGVDTERFRPRSPDDPAVREGRRALALERPWILYPARLEHPAKNHARLLEAFASSNARTTHTLAFVGSDWGAGAMLQDLARSLDLGDAVRFGGRVSEVALEGLVAGADLVAMPGLAEGFGLPAIEALACGVRVIAARAGALPEVVDPLGVLFDPRDVTAMRDAIDRTLEDGELAARVRVAGPAHAARWSWDRAAESLAALCTDAIRRRDRAATTREGSS